MKKREKGSNGLMGEEESDFGVCERERERERESAAILTEKVNSNLVMCIAHDLRTSVTMDCCHLTLFATTPAHLCATNPYPKNKKNCETYILGPHIVTT